MNKKNKFLILGCGHSESLKNYNNNAAVLSPMGNMLIDCGYTIKHALNEQSMTIKDIDAIFITHVHGDHVYGLERVAFETRYLYRKRVKLFVDEAIVGDLWDNTLKGTLGLNSEGLCGLGDYFDIVIIKKRTFSYAGNTYQTIPVVHTPNKPTFGLLINSHIFYSSDTVSIPWIFDEINFEIGFHDVTLTADNPVHAPLRTLINDYPKALRDKLYLMSYEDNWPAFLPEVNQFFAGFATQGMSVEF